MKKLFTSVFATVIACVSLLCLFGCGDATFDGKYVLNNASGQAGGPLASIMKKDDAGNYVNVNHGEFVPENFRVEIKGKTMTIHGSISPVGGGGILKFNVNQDTVREIKIAKLETWSGNGSYFEIFDEKGEDTLWHVSKDGNLAFEYRSSEENGTWHSIMYKKV